MAVSRVKKVTWALMATAFACHPPHGLIATLRAQDQRGVPSSEGHEIPTGNSTRDVRDLALKGIPFNQLTPGASTKIKGIVEHSSYFRRMPTQTVECEPDMFAFLVRNPEVIVNIWDVMGITKVQLNRTGQYQHQGNDGAGTGCKMDLIFGNDNCHVYYVSGGYKGTLWPKELSGNCVLIIHNKNSVNSSGANQVTVSMDVFMKLENIGADLIVRTLGPLVSRSADYNFIECVAFVAQVSQIATRNPQGIQNLASRLNQIDPKVRDQFVQTAQGIAERNSRIARSQGVQLTPSGYSVSEAIESEPVILQRVTPPELSNPSVKVSTVQQVPPFDAARLDSSKSNTAMVSRTQLGSQPGSLSSGTTPNGEAPVSTRKGTTQPSSTETSYSSESPTIQKLNRDSLKNVPAPPPKKSP